MNETRKVFLETTIMVDRADEGFTKIEKSLQMSFGTA